MPRDIHTSEVMWRQQNVVFNVWRFVLGQNDHEVVAGQSSPSSDRHAQHLGLCHRRQQRVRHRHEADAVSVAPHSRRDFEVCKDRRRPLVGSSPLTLLAVPYRPASVRETRRSLCSAHQNTFLSRVSTLTRDIDIAILSVRLSVCLSVTRWYCMKTAEHIVIVFHYTVAQSFQFYQHQTSSLNSDRVTPYGGAKYRWCIKFRDFLPISRYISQTVQDIAISIPYSALLCHNLKCKDYQHFGAIDQYLNDITNACLSAGQSSIPHTTKWIMSTLAGYLAGVRKLNPFDKNLCFGIKSGMIVADRVMAMWPIVCDAQEPAIIMLFVMLKGIKNRSYAIALHRHY